MDEFRKLCQYIRVNNYAHKIRGTKKSGYRQVVVYDDIGNLVFDAINITGRDGLLEVMGKIIRQNKERKSYVLRRVTATDIIGMMEEYYG